MVKNILKKHITIVYRRCNGRRIIFYLILSIIVHILIIFICIVKYLKYLKEEKNIDREQIKTTNKIIIVLLKTILLASSIVELYIFIDVVQKVGTLKNDGFLYCTIVFIVMTVYTFFTFFIGVHLLELNLDKDD